MHAWTSTSTVPTSIAFRSVLRFGVPLRVAKFLAGQACACMTQPLCCGGTNDPLVRSLLAPRTPCTARLWMIQYPYLMYCAINSPTELILSPSYHELLCEDLRVLDRSVRMVRRTPARIYLSLVRRTALRPPVALSGVPVISLSYGVYCSGEMTPRILRAPRT